MKCSCKNHFKNFIDYLLFYSHKIKIIFIDTVKKFIYHLNMYIIIDYYGFFIKIYTSEFGLIEKVKIVCDLK